jgi:ribose transport system ATP-binding protein
MPKNSLLTMRGISKNFGPTCALKQVALDVQQNQVLALIGENGAGKSTLLKVLSGAIRADSGTMEVQGREYRPRGPHDARDAGIAMIYQELNLAPDLSVEDNILLGQPGTGAGFLFRPTQRQAVREVLDRVGLGTLDPKSIIGKQSVATQQLVEIARALLRDARLILFDEPTSSLPQKDVIRLFEIIRGLRTQGIGIVYISHFLEEVREICDSWSVLRDGENVGHGRIDDVTDDEIVTLMVGRDVEELYPVVPHKPGQPLVQIENLTGTPYPAPTNCVLRQGEIFGIAGLVGAGRTELLRAIFSLDPIEGGKVSKANIRVKNSIRAKMKSGFGFLSEDRKNEGLAQDLSIIENITLSRLNEYTRLGWINWSRRREAAWQRMSEVHVKADNAHQAVNELSGGNQQKVAIARILHQDSDILLLDEPTKGIDVGTKAEIYRLMGQLAAAGKTVVFVSSYLPDLLAICDRIGVMARGELRDIRESKDWTEETILQTAIEVG